MGIGEMIKTFLKYAALFALAVFLIRLAVCYILQIWWVLLIIAVVAVGGWFALKWWRDRHNL